MMRLCVSEAPLAVDVNPPAQASGNGPSPEEIAAQDRRRAPARARALIAAYGMALDATLKDSSLSTPQRTGLTQLRTKVETMTDAEILAL